MACLREEKERMNVMLGRQLDLIACLEVRGELLIAAQRAGKGHLFASAL